MNETIGTISGRVESMTMLTGSDDTVRVGIYCDHFAVDLPVPREIAEPLRLGDEVQLTLTRRARVSSGGTGGGGE